MLFCHTYSKTASITSTLTFRGCGMTFLAIISVDFFLITMMTTVFLLLTHRLPIVPQTVGVLQQLSPQHNKRGKLINLNCK